MSEKKQKCGNCVYWDDFNGVCFNSDSSMCADFTDDDYVCSVFEERGEL